MRAAYEQRHRPCPKRRVAFVSMCRCWASNGLARSTRHGPSTGCNMTCTGDSSQTCGGL